MSHPWKLGSDTVAAIREARREGMRPRQIAKRLGISSGAAYKYSGKVWRRRVARIASNGYAKWGHSYVHRIVAEAWHGPIPRGSHVHHRDGDKLNNHPENLVIIPAAKHASGHAKERDKWTPAMEEFLVEASRAGVPARFIAKVLGVKKTCVDARRKKLREHGAIGRCKTGRRRAGWEAEAVALYERSPFYGEEAA